MNRWKKSAKIAIFGSTLLITLYIVITITYASAFSFYFNDDFSNANGIGLFNAPIKDCVVNSVNYTKNIYSVWQGTYFSTFIQALLSPLNNGGLNRLRIIMVINSCLFFLSLLTFTNTVINNFVVRLDICEKSIISMIICIMLMGFNFYGEIFFWYTGAMQYSVALSLFFLGFSLIVYSNKKGNKTIVPYIIGIVLGFCSMGGNLAVAGIGCYVLFVYSIYMYTKEKRIDIKSTAALIIMVVGALINVLAPGNYKRHDQIDSTGIHIFESLKNSVYMIDSRMQYLVRNTCFVALLIAIVLFGFLVSKKNSMCKKVLPYSVLGLATPLFGAFPIALGYSSSNLPERCAFMIDVSIIISFLIFFISIGGYLITIIINKESQDLFKVFICVIISTVFLLDGTGLDKVTILKMNDQLVSGAYRNHYEDYVAFFDSLSGHEGEDITISRASFPEDLDYYHNLSLNSNSTHWVNNAIAKYIGLNSISISELPGLVKCETVYIGDIQLNGDGYLDIREYKPYNTNFLYCGVADWSSITPACGLSFTSNGYYILGESNAIIKGLSVRYCYLNDTYLNEH